MKADYFSRAANGSEILGKKRSSGGLLASHHREAHQGRGAIWLHGICGGNEAINHSVLKENRGKLGDRRLEGSPNGLIALAYFLLPCGTDRPDLYHRYAGLY